MRIYETKHEILDDEIDVTGKLTLPKILSLSIGVSTKQSLAYGVGPEYTHAVGLGWVVLQHVITINRRPESGETMTISTHGKEFNPFLAKRDYTFVDEQGYKIIQVDSLYTMMDMKKRKMARIPTDLVDVFDPDRVKRVPHPDKPDRIAEDEAITCEQAYQVRYSDIDSNQHVNNARYLDWAQDPLGMDFLRTHEPKEVNIKFEHEVRWGEMIDVKIAQQADETKHQIWYGDELSAEVSIKWTQA